MNRISALACCLILLTAACPQKQADPNAAGQPATQAPKIRAGLWILEPADGAQVAYRPNIVGTVSDKAVPEVWVVVRAVGMEGYWVQPPAAVDPNGVWVCQPYIGEESSAAGTGFEVMAFAKPAVPLAAGTQLDNWPAAGMKSKLLTVSR
jgi:hypothetical protein